MITADIDVEPSGAYEIEPMARFGDTIRFVGGINKPKLVECYSRSALSSPTSSGCIKPETTVALLFLALYISMPCASLEVLLSLYLGWVLI